MRVSSSVVKGRRCRGGFTLIELLVVVAIVAIACGILLPVLASSKLQAHRLTGEGQVKGSSIPVERTVLPMAPQPVIDSLDLNLALSSSYHLIGMDASSR